MSEPISLFVPTALIAGAAVPLALQRVPPNRFYGVRTAQTLANRESWFRVNRFAGWVFLAAAALTTGVYLSIPEMASGRSFLRLAGLRRTDRCCNHGRDHLFSTSGTPASVTAAQPR
jgi:hypothetical protein